MRRLSLLVAPFIFLGLFSFAHAQSTAELQAQLNVVLQQLSLLQSEMTTQTGGASIPAASSGTYGQCPSLNRTLRQGISGSDVTGLQAFFAADTSIYPEGTVSGYFGVLTQAAVQRFQQRHAIVTSGTPESTGYGMVGPATRAVIASVCGGSTPAAGTVQRNCSISGVTMASGGTIQLYSVTSAPAGATCAAYAQTRQCINGGLSGSATYQYASCNDASTQCIVNGSTVANNTALTFYSRQSVGVNDSCSSFAQTRTCANGVLSGSSDYQYVSCNTAPDSCSVGGVTVAHGASRTFYKQDIATSTASCSAYGQTRTCNDGVLSGSSDYSKASCTAGICSLDGAVLQSGESKAFYFAQNVPANEQCLSYAQSRTCTNGTLGGSAAYKYASCAPAVSGSCVLDNVAVSSESSATFYSTSTAAVGTSCVSASQSRTCTSGTFSGSASYNRASCSDISPCTLDGVTVPHGNSFTFYSARMVAFGTTCSSVSQTRICTNSALSGDATYQYSGCSVNPPVSSANVAQLAAALTALESVLHSMLSYLDSWF